MRLWRDLAHNAKLLSCQFCLVASAGLQDWELQLGWRMPFAFAPSWCAPALLAPVAPPAMLADAAAAALLALGAYPPMLADAGGAAYLPRFVALTSPLGLNLVLMITLKS